MFWNIAVVGRASSTAHSLHAKCFNNTSCYGLNKKTAVTNELSPLDTSSIITVSAEHFLNRKQNTIAKLCAL